MSGEATAAVASLGVLHPPPITLEGHSLHVALIDEVLQRPLGPAVLALALAHRPPSPHLLARLGLWPRRTPKV